MKFLSAYREQTYALMRIVVGLLFIQHGIMKVVAFLSGSMPANNFLMLLAAFIESVGGLLIIIGWYTRLAAFVTSGEMAAAYFIGHFPEGVLPINNKGELAVFYCFVFLFIAAYGAGIWSIDSTIENRKGSLSNKKGRY
jgi:putative oxidoreductase